MRIKEEEIHRLQSELQIKMKENTAVKTESTPENFQQQEKLQSITEENIRLKGELQTKVEEIHRLQSELQIKMKENTSAAVSQLQILLIRMATCIASCVL